MPCAGKFRSNGHSPRQAYGVQLDRASSRIYNGDCLACDWPRDGNPRSTRLLAFALLVCLPLSVAAQTTSVAPDEQKLLSAPAVNAVATHRNDGPQEDSGVISGTVLDSSGSEIEGAQVVLGSPAGAGMRSARSGSNGEFSFAGLPPGVFQVVVSGQGWGTYTSPAFELEAGQSYIVTGIVLRLSTSASVRVTADSEQLAEEQVHIAEQQRVLVVFPNFYTSFDWNAPPLGGKQKFQLALRSMIDPVELIGPAVIAGFEQETDVFPGYGGGAQGYGKRYGAACANALSAKFFAHAVYPSVFHQDPRYFYKGTGGFRARALYAISASLMARSDSGHWEPNYSYILGTFTAGALSNTYYPPENRSALLTFSNGLADIAGESGANLLREFVLQRFTSRAAQRASQKP